MGAGVLCLFLNKEHEHVACEEDRMNRGIQPRQLPASNSWLKIKPTQRLTFVRHKRKLAADTERGRTAPSSGCFFPLYRTNSPPRSSSVSSSWMMRA